MLRARLPRGLHVLAAAAAVSLACGKIAGIEEPTAASASASVDISPAELTFGTVECGTEVPAGQVITIANTGSSPAEYKVDLPDGTAFRLEGPLTGTIQPGAAAVTIKAFVTANAASDVTSEVLVSVGPTLKNIPLRATGHGATIEFDPVVQAFGDVRMQAGGTADVVVHNRGNADLAIASFDGQTADFTVVNGGAVKVAAGQDGKVTVTLTADTKDSGPLTATLVPKTVGSLCGPPGSITATGRRVNSDVIISSGDFGKQPCNTTPTKDVVIQNYSGSVLNYTASFPGGSPFAITKGNSGTIGKGTSTTAQTATITIAPTAPLTVGATPPTDTLTVQIDGIPAPAGGTRLVPVQVDVRGAVITADPTAITNFQRPYYVWNQKVLDTRDIALTNTGNEPVSINWTWTSIAGDPAWRIRNFPGSLAVGQNVTASVAFDPQGNCPCELHGTPVATGGGPICNTLTLDFKGN